MLTSARNEFAGKVAAINEGAVNDEIEITLTGGDRIVAVITRTSTASLGLKVGADALALVKAPWVILSVPDNGIKLSTRNRLEGTVKTVKPGAVNTEVEVSLKGGQTLAAIVTQESAQSLGLAVGKPVLAFFKASHVIVGVKA
ncbi:MULTISPECIES: TOBE domain-containing protein [unclassified Herbaspirillum]|uniref:TOBE domain-containing protein n=1 Tax=unclassified Herbaspirillum TaxID=2624150 RepID=UPI000E2EF328|nr:MULTISPECIES: TOBE domain-containing protein [unclassified Herbaspirillum]RFB65646.1 transporter [Herbaspirillum sp. 3R-3a1]TFI09050.1 transporter [Herbaspirillum sp. 3R11]TFI15468.1 transporter [Herbaspirillum sp. 3R-11]TFI31761.1 transporter [Herbaspirillum sp. 3C11]